MSHTSAMSLTICLLNLTIVSDGTFISPPCKFLVSQATTYPSALEGCAPGTPLSC